MGALQYLTWTKLYIAFIVYQVCQFMHNPTTDHRTAIKRVFRYTKGTVNHGLIFNKSPNLELKYFSDANWAHSLDDQRSTSRQYVFLANNLISWSAKKQHTVAKSSTESEYKSLAHSAVRPLYSDGSNPTYMVWQYWRKWYELPSHQLEGHISTIDYMTATSKDRDTVKSNDSTRKQISLNMWAINLIIIITITLLLSIKCQPNVKPPPLWPTMFTTSNMTNLKELFFIQLADWRL